MYVCIIYICIMYICIMYVCMYYVLCMYVLCMYVLCTYVQQNIQSHYSNINRCWHQRSAINRFFSTHKYSSHFEYEWVQRYWNSTTLTHSYSVQHWFISTGSNEYEHNVDIKLVTFEICLIHTGLLTQILSKFTVLVVAAFSKKKKKEKDKDSKQSKHTTFYCVL